MTNAREQVEIGPVKQPVSLDVVLPGSKSYSVRMLLIAALANGPSKLSGLLMGTDTLSTVRVLRELGVGIEMVTERSEELVVVHGNGGRWSEPSNALQVGESATLARLLTAILAAGPQSSEWLLECDIGLGRRCSASLFEALRLAGGRVYPEEKPGCFPVRIRGGGYSSSVVTVDASSTSQNVSAALIGAVAAGRPMTVRVVNRQVQLGYINMTIAALAQFGHEVDVRSDAYFEVRPARRPLGRDIAVEPDVSTAAYPASLAALTAGSVRIRNYPTTTSQPDAGFLSVLSLMGCDVSRQAGTLVISGPSRLRGGFRIQMNEMADQTLTLAALAVFADGPIEISDIERVRGHESDRVESLMTVLMNMGIGCRRVEDGIRVDPGQPVPVTVEPNRDHRVAMAFALVGAATEGIQIRDPDCVAKSFPGFFEMLRIAGVAVRRSSTVATAPEPAD